EDVAVVGEDGAAEGGIEIAALPDLPAQDLADFPLALGVETVDHADLGLGGIGHELGFIEADEAVEILDAAHVTEAGNRLDDVLQLLAEPGGAVEDALERGDGKPHIELA